MCVCSGPVLIAGRLPWWFREVSATVCTDQRVFRDIERFLCVVPVEIMAGNYFYDPRPFYGMNNYNLVPLDEVWNQFTYSVFCRNCLLDRSLSERRLTQSL